MSLTWCDVCKVECLPRISLHLLVCLVDILAISMLKSGNADVIKTRLQVEARKGQTTYKGLGDAFVKICERICVRLDMHRV